MNIFCTKEPIVCWSRKELHQRPKSLLIVAVTPCIVLQSFCALRVLVWLMLLVGKLYEFQLIRCPLGPTYRYRFATADGLTEIDIGLNGPEKLSNSTAYAKAVRSPTTDCTGMSVWKAARPLCKYLAAHIDETPAHGRVWNSVQGSDCAVSRLQSWTSFMEDWMGIPRLSAPTATLTCYR